MASPKGLASTAAASIQAASGTERAGEPRGSFLDVARSGGREVFFRCLTSEVSSSLTPSFSSSSLAVTSTTLALSEGGIAPRATSQDVRLAAVRLLLLPGAAAEEDAAATEDEEDDDVDGGSFRQRRRRR